MRRERTPAFASATAQYDFACLGMSLARSGSVKWLCAISSTLGVAGLHRFPGSVGSRCIWRLFARNKSHLWLRGQIMFWILVPTWTRVGMRCDGGVVRVIDALGDHVALNAFRVVEEANCCCNAIGGQFGSICLRERLVNNL